MTTTVGPEWMCCEVAIALCDERRDLGMEAALASDGPQARHRLSVRVPETDLSTIEQSRPILRAAGRRLARILKKSGDYRLFPAWTPSDGMLLDWVRVEGGIGFDGRRERPVSLLCLTTRNADKSWSLLFDVTGGKVVTNDAV